MKLSISFQRFFESGKATGILLIGCTVISMILANSGLSAAYLGFWAHELGGLPLAEWINEALMAVFFLHIGLELERELYVGELSDRGSALLPVVAALGGACVPALIHSLLNPGGPARAGAGIPMATDIAFALGALALLGRRIPASLKIFLTALAVMDDLAAMVVIAVFYTAHFSPGYLLGALGVLAVLVVFNRVLHVMRLTPYLIGGVVLWFLMLRSGVHPTLAGVMLAFAIPFTGKGGPSAMPSHRLENALHRPVALVVLPLFALANTALVIDSDWMHGLLSSNGVGIALGLVIGKPLGITIAAVGAVAVGACRLPSDLGWRHIVGVGMLGGIGFTMSIFITNLAFGGNEPLIAASKMAIMLASATAGILGYLWLRLLGGPEPAVEQPSAERADLAA